MTIKEIMQLRENEDQSAIINRLKQGRSQATGSVDLAMKGLNPELHDINDHVKRPDKTVRSDSETNEMQNTINVTGSMEERPQTKQVPVARIALALQRLIVNRAVAFLFGNPPTLQADTREGTKEDEVLASLQRVLQTTKAKTINRQIARKVFEMTEAAEYWHITTQSESTNIYGFDSPFKLRCTIFSPDNGDVLYPYFNTDGDLIAFSREFDITQTNIYNKQKIMHYFETFTASTLYRWKMEDGKWELDEGYPKKNTIGKIPVVYSCQPTPEWVLVQGLIDRLETLMSNFADTNDYHASPKIFTTGDIHGWAQKGESGAVIEGADGATAQYLSWSQAPESVKLEIETLLRMIHTITQTPDISFDSVKGLNLSGVALRLLFMDAHLKVQDKAETFESHLQRRNSIIQGYLAQMNAKDAAYAQACSTLVAEPVIQSYMIEDDTTKVANLMAATGHKAIASRRLAVQRLGWSKDPDVELEEIEAEEASTAAFDITEPTL